MSAAGVAAPRMPGRRASGPHRAATVLSGAGESLTLRLVAFFALCWFGALEWAGFAVSPPNGRVFAVVAIVTAAGVALALAPRAPLGPRLRALLCVAIVLAAAVAACLAAGLPVRLLAPARWDTLGDGLDRGLAGVSTSDWPYRGSDTWVRLTVMLGIPALALPATALAFWPLRRSRGLYSGLALVLLLALFAIPATERDTGSPIGRGALLLVLIAAWLWLPRLRGRQLVPALLALAAAGLVALPAASALTHHEAWVDWSQWNLFASHGGGHRFDWTHRYGPLDWPREGTTMFEVRSPHQHYWKAETLDRFDGLRWSHSDAGSGSDPSAELPPARNPRWQERIAFSVRGLSSSLLIGAGTTYAVDGSHVLVGSGDGTVRVLDGPLGKGDAYTISAYVPDPTAAQMRAASPRYQTQFLSYTYFDLPGARDSALTEPPPAEGGRSVTPRTVGAPVPGRVPGDDALVRRRILASPYARDYRLARRLAAGQPTAYDVVKSVERHLQRGFTYDERPPLRPIPLDAFLFRDKVGYCQQFSGAMALLLRMNGIPARVAAGFSPGIPDPQTKEFRVRDLDAHSWVEVWFDGIGWVPFDPTPSLAPASAQATEDRLASAAIGGHDSGKDAAGKKRTEPADLTGGRAPGGSRVWLVVLAAIGLPLAGLVALWTVAVVRARRVRRAGGDPDVRELRFALERLGHRLGAGDTLLELERRLRVTAGAGAVGYVHALRERRFGSARAAVALDRRALRRGLAEGRGPIVKLRALLVLPPRRHGGATAGSS
ncbi:MAG: protein-glutamine gamma-glutamyltransferase [Thermoleophilaceae bacterium]|nr:protein-glutamine gamma-glutamyltransferase [Thermoleophilaceae bacterium]